MAKKKQFDWKNHSKPARLLSPAQEEAFCGGPLAPLLELALSIEGVRMEIRARSANVYCWGAPVLRIAGEGPFAVEIEDLDGGTAHRAEVTDVADVASLQAAVESAHERLAGQPASRRAALHEIAASNSGRDLFADELIVIDTEYNLGQRKLDLVAVRRSEGVTGPGGFANPELVFSDVRLAGQSLSGAAGLAAVAADFAEFAKALGGEHLQRAKEEMAALTAQKVRLGLLPDELELRGFTDSLPELLVIFDRDDVAEPGLDEGIVALHEKLSARHYPTDRLLFAHTGFDDSGQLAAFVEGDGMSYREFKAYRQSLR